MDMMVDTVRCNRTGNKYISIKDLVLYLQSQYIEYKGRDRDSIVSRATIKVLINTLKEVM